MLSQVTSVRLLQLNSTALSEKGYGTVTYMVSKNHQNQTHSAFIIGKSRVMQWKPVPTLRLELTAASMAAKDESLIGSESGGVCLLDRQHASHSVSQK